MVSVAITSAPAHRQSCISRRPIGPCPTTSTVWPLRHARLAHRLQAGVHGLDEGGLLRPARRPGSAIAPRSTIQSMRLDVLREAAARGLEAGGGAVALVALALGVGPRAQ